METFIDILLNILLLLPMLISISLLIFSVWIDIKRYELEQKTESELDEIVSKKQKEIEDGIGKELAKAKEENNRLKELCDRTLTTIKEQDEKLNQLQEENEKLKKELEAKQNKK